MARASVFRQSIKVFIDANLSPAARSRQFAAVARAGVADLVRSGRAPDHRLTFVDGVQGASEDAVRPDHGVISYTFPAAGDAVVFALEFLRNRSPVGTGRYRDSFFVAVNGRPVAAASLDPKAIPADAECIIYNSQPYNRKVDVQLVGRRHLQFSVPENIYADAARAVAKQFGNSVTAQRLADVDFPGKYTLRRQHTRADRRSGGADAGSKIQSPGLVIRPVV